MLQGTPEHRFIQNMKDLRLSRGWSQERLTAEVERVTGHRMSATVITKLEWALDPAKAEKARGLRLDEAIAIAQTLQEPVESLTQAVNPLAPILANVRRAEAALDAVSRKRALAEASLKQLREEYAEAVATVQLAKQQYERLRTAATNTRGKAQREAEVQRLTDAALAARREEESAHGEHPEA